MQFFTIFLIELSIRMCAEQISSLVLCHLVNFNLFRCTRIDYVKNLLMRFIILWLLRLCLKIDQHTMI